MQKVLRLKLCHKIRSKLYKQIIEVRVPVRFYWDEDGFDGIEFSPLAKLNKYQLGLINDVLNELMMLMGQSQEVNTHNHKAITKVPDVFRKAFEKE